MNNNVWKVLSISAIILLLLDLVYLGFNIAFILMYRYNILDIISDISIMSVINIVALIINSIMCVVGVSTLIYKKITTRR